MGKQQLKWRISKTEAGMRLLQFLREKCKQAPSVKAIKRAIDGKFCSVNGRIENFSSFTLTEGDFVVLSTEAFATAEAVHAPQIPILYEDPDLLIINKPVGFISDARSLKRTFSHLESLELVHRLDKETSGVLILAKNPAMKKKLIALFKERAVRKLYLALVDGVVEKEEGKIDNYLGEKHSYQGQTIYGAVSEKKGQRAITYWKTVQRGKTATVVCCEPYTGRTHQLRAHLSEMGHPILGDVQYAKKFACSLKPQRNLLHAYRIGFEHPSTGKRVQATAPIPSDFSDALQELKISLKKGV